MITTLFKKGLTENGGINFKSLIPKPYPAWATGATVGCNGCGPTLAAQRLLTISGKIKIFYPNPLVWNLF
ncbi:MAG: hypothetical protein GX152_00855 [Methanosarcina sp.]|nr:hypothetical protein [Methanosarcina sp.]